MVAEDPEVAAAISDLLVRRADPEHGRVLVGGVDTRELSLDALRAHVVTVDGHHPWLVDGTLGENLALGAPDADPVDVGTRAPRTRRVRTCSTRRSGIDQPIGERGLSLSGGQRQRLTVARSYAASPPVLVLDEPTSALDVVTELRLLSRLRDARAGRTTVLLTISAPALAQCDRVVVVDAGRVVSQGLHDELLHDPHYRDLVAPDAS